MKKLALALFFLLLCGSSASAATVYYAQTAAGSANGTDCADAFALPASLSVSAGNIYMYCATGTYAAGTSPAVTLTGGGSSGNPAIFRFAHSAVMQAPYWGQNGAIRIAASYITVDGSPTGTPCGYIAGVDTSCDGTIKATANGATLANHVAGGKCVWINGSLTGSGMQNVNCQNLFVPAGSGNSNNETTGSFSGNSMCVYVDFTSQQITIQNNVCNNAQSLVRIGYQGTSGNTFVIQNNVFSNTGEGIWIGAGNSNSSIDSGGTISKINNNDFSNLTFDTAPFPPCTGSGANHQEFIHLFTQQTNSQIGTSGAPFQISNNYFHGLTGCSFTSEIYIECDSAAQCGAPNHLFVDLFNNRIISEDPNSALALNAGGNGMSECEGSTCRYVNNTYYSDVGHSSSSNFAQHCESGSIVLLQDNIFDGMNAAFVPSGCGTTTTKTNLGFGLATACGTTCTLSANPLLNTSSVPPYQLTSSSSGAYQAGFNGTALGITALDSDALGVSRPSVGNWDVGAFQLGGTSPGISFTPTSLTFASQITGTTSAPQNITVKNTGTATLLISSITLTGTNAADFGQTNNCAAGISAGGSCTIAVTFTPSATGSRTASVSVTDNAAGSPQTVGLTGTGVSATAVVSFTPTSLAFGSQNIATSSTPQSVTLTNTGTATLTISGIAIAGTNPGDFSQTNTCTATIGISASCAINVTFRPTATGSRSATVSVRDNAAGSPQTVPLTGTGTAAGPVTLTPSTLSFGTIAQGTLSGWQNVTISNATGSTITLTSYSFTGTNSGDFLAYAGYNNTGVWTNNGGAGEAWTLSQFIVDSNGNMQTVTTAGTGGTGSHPTWATVLGQATTDGSAVWNMIGAYPNGCGATLATGSSCVAVIAFQPTAAGGTNETATLNVNFTGGGTSPVTAPVTGTSGSGFVSPNLPSAPQQVNLPLTLTHTAINPYGAALNQALLTPATTYTVCASGCNYTDAQLQTALNQAFSDCQTKTSLVQLFNTESISTTTGFTVGNGTNGCAAGKYLRFETNHPELLPADGNRVNHSYSGVMPQLVEANATGYTIQLDHSMCGFEMRGIGFSNSSSFVSQSNFTFRASDELVTATAAIPCNVILDQNLFWAGGVTGNLSRNAILADANNIAVINSDVENYQYTSTDNQAIVSFCSNGPALISNNTFSATTENVDVGGNGCSITDGGISGNPFPVPSNYTIASNYIFKPLRWRSFNCGATTGTYCGAGFSFIDLSPQPTTSACTGSQCQVNVSFFEASTRPDMHPYDNAVLANCANALFNGTYAILLSPLPVNVGNPFTFSVINTNLNSTNAPNGTTTTGCTIQSFYDPQYVPPADGAFQYDVKNLYEMKEGLNFLLIGNWFATTWEGSQSEMLIFQETNPVLGTTNYSPWDAAGNIRITTNTWDNADINGYGLDMWTALNGQLTNTAAAGSSQGTIAPIEFDNNLVYHLGPQFGYYEEWASHGNPTAPMGNGQLPDLFFNHDTVLQSSVNTTLGVFDVINFASPNNLQVGQTPFLRNAINNSILDFGQIANGVVAYPYVNQKCEINSGLAVPCFTPAAWAANIPIATIAGGTAPYGCTNVNATASFQPNAGPHGLGSSFCPSANLAAIGFVSTTITTASSPISPGIATVTPASMANIATGQTLFVGSSTNAEFVVVTGITGSTFTANFANAHNSNITTVYGTSLPASSVGHGTGTDSLDVGANGPAVVAMTQWVPSGIPTTPAAVTLVPSSLAFGNQAVSTTSASQIVQLYNTGSVTLTISSITITGTNAGDFAQTNNCGSSVLAGGSCTLIVTFTPSANGSRSASISIADSAAGSPQTVPLAGTGFTPTPAISVSPSSLTFATQTVGTPSNAQVIILSNTGTATVTFSSISITGTNAGDYGQTNNCGSSLPVQTLCSVLVTFMPTAAGTRTANVSIADNVSGSPQTVSLSGTGVVGPLVAPDPAIFACVPTGLWSMMCSGIVNSPLVLLSDDTRITIAEPEYERVGTPSRSSIAKPKYEAVRP